MSKDVTLFFTPQNTDITQCTNTETTVNANTEITSTFIPVVTDLDTTRDRNSACTFNAGGGVYFAELHHDARFGNTVLFAEVITTTMTLFDRSVKKQYSETSCPVLFFVIVFSVCMP